MKSLIKVLCATRRRRIPIVSPDTMTAITLNSTTISVMKRAMPLLLLALAAFAQTGKQPKPLSNAGVLEMSRAGVPESTLILVIRNTPVKFDVSAEGILAPHAAGITESVLNQMLRAATPHKSGPSFGVTTGSFPVRDAAGKTVRFSAWIKTENVLNGYAGRAWGHPFEPRRRGIAVRLSNAVSWVRQTHQ